MYVIILYNWPNNTQEEDNDYWAVEEIYINDYMVEWLQKSIEIYYF
jgi:hypothetical protein